MTKRSEGLTGFINRRLFLTTLLSTLLAAIISTVYTLTEFNIALKPRLLQKAEAVAEVVREDIELALSVGIPFDRIKGMDLYLEETAAQYPELVYLLVTDEAGRVLYRGGNAATASAISDEPAAPSLRPELALQAGFFSRLLVGGQELLRLLPLGDGAENQAENLSLALTGDGHRYGAVQVGLDTDYIRTQLTDVFFDITIVLIAVLLVSFEVVMVLVMFYISGPLQRSENILERQAEGDFSVNEARPDKGSIGTFIGKLNNDSQQLQQRFRVALDQATNGGGATISEPDDIPQTDKPGLGQRLRRLASQFNLLKVLREKQGSITDARIPLFVFSFAEELQKSFMPLFVAEYYEPNPWFDKEIMVGLPISVFMFVIAAATPFAGGWVDRWGNKRLFFCGLLPALAGYLGCALASSVYEIIFWRGVTAFGYAIITISCQGYIAAIVTAENRAKGMAIFVGVLMTATMCGTALGGIIADRIGYQPVFLLSALLTCFAGLLAWLMLSNEVDKKSAKAPAGKGGGALALAGNLRFVCIVLFCAIPAKIILTGFLYYLVPLYLVSLDASQSEIGRIMMVYSLIIIPLGPIASRLADRSGQMVELVILGTVLSGIILISLYGEASVMTMLLAVAMMGAAHSILKAPLIAAAMEAAEATPEVGRTTALGVLRTSERIGSVLGPVLVAGLLAVFDYGQAMAIVGAGIITAGIVMSIYLKVAAKKEALAP